MRGYVSLLKTAQDDVVHLAEIQYDPHCMRVDAVRHTRIYIYIHNQLFPTCLWCVAISANPGKYGLK